jgi:hypothetical protein
VRRTLFVRGVRPYRTFAFSGAVAEPPRVTKSDVDRWTTELSNWGRWGKSDQIGTLNLITAEKRKQALKLARDGVSVSMAHTLDKEQFPDNARPIGQQMTLDTSIRCATTRLKESSITASRGRRLRRVPGVRATASRTRRTGS